MFGFFAGANWPMVVNEEATALVRNTFSEVLYLVVVVGEIISVRAHLKLLLFQL